MWLLKLNLFQCITKSKIEGCNACEMLRIGPLLVIIISEDSAVEKWWKKRSWNSQNVICQKEVTTLLN